MPSSEGGLGSALVGEKIAVNQIQVVVQKLLGEGGFAFIYLVKEIADASGQAERSGSGNGSSRRPSGGNKKDDGQDMVLKITSIVSRQQRDIAEKEAKLLSRLSHPSIVKMFDTCYRTVPSKSKSDKQKERAQHMILMEHCEGGHALDVCTQLVKKGERFDLSTLIIAFGQICNAVSYLHAQRPPIVHRDLKPENFLIKSGAYKLCDFGSAVFGHVDLKTSKARSEAEEVIEKTTTQMYRAPEMVDLYMAKKLTQATDVWALGCCLYCLAFLQNCFEEGSNLAILSRNYKIPDDNPYGDGLSQLIDRMLDVDSKSRADMTEVILCLSAVYSGKPLPPRKERKHKEKKEKEDSGDKEHKEKKEKKKKAGTFNPAGPGATEDLTIDPKKAKEAKKLDPNSAAARRRQAANGGGDSEFAAFHSKFDDVKSKSKGGTGNVNQDMAFSTESNPFASFDGKDASSGDGGMFGSFDGNNASAEEVANAFNSSHDWDTEFSQMTINDHGRGRATTEGERRTRSRSQDHRRRRKGSDKHKNETPEEAIDRLAAEDDEDSSVAASAVMTGTTAVKRVVPSRGVRRNQSSQQRQGRSLSRGAGLRRTKSGQVRSQNRKGDDARAQSYDSDSDDDSNSE